MGRKNLKEQRSAEIIEALERCIQKRGLESTTLEQVAEEAGISRRIIRHYLGNREDMILTAIRQIEQKHMDSAMAVLGEREGEARVESALDYLFSEEFNNQPLNNLLAGLLATAVRGDDLVQGAMKRIYDKFQSVIEDELLRALPGAKREDCRKAAFTIMTLAFGSGWMMQIGFSRELTENNKATAYHVIRSLAEEVGHAS
jgi:AcrR family transcriptional regulator